LPPVTNFSPSFPAISKILSKAGATMRTYISLFTINLTIYSESIDVNSVLNAINAEDSTIFKVRALLILPPLK
jgi:hypothetical protein